MQRPQWRFSQRRLIKPSSLHYFSLAQTSLSIFSTNILALRIYSNAFSCFFISLRMAALLRYVGTISYFSSSLKSLMRVSSRSMAQLTAFSAIMKCLFFLRMQAKLLKVSIFNLERVEGSVRFLGVCGSMTMSTALEMNFILPPYSQSLMFSMASLFTFWMNFPISSPTLNSTCNCYFSSSIRERWISFSSQRMHQMELLQSLSLNLTTTAQMQCRICSLLMELSYMSSSLLGASIEIMYDSMLICSMGRKEGRCQKSAVLVLAGHAQALLICSDYHSRPGFADVAGVSNGGLVFPGFFSFDLGRSSVFEQGAEKWRCFLMGGLPLRQHAKLHRVVVIAVIGGGGLFVGRRGSLLLLLWHIVVVSCVAYIGLIESLRIAHLADPVSTVSSVQQRAILIKKTVAEVALGEGFQFFFANRWQPIVLNSNLY